MSIRNTIAEVSKNKRIPATIIAVYGKRVSVRLGGSGIKVTNLRISGSANIGDAVYVDYSSGTPFVITTLSSS